MGGLTNNFVVCYFYVLAIISQLVVVFHFFFTTYVIVPIVDNVTCSMKLKYTTKRSRQKL